VIGQSRVVDDGYRFEVREFAPELIDDAASLLAERHRRQRIQTPALNELYAEPAGAYDELHALSEQKDASGAVALRAGEMAAYVLGVRRADEKWGPNIWIEAAGHAASEPEAIRVAYAVAAERWVADGRTNHFAVVPAADSPAIDAWFSLGFGQQQVHAIREPPPPDFVPSARPGMTVRPPKRADLPALAELELVLPRHQRESPVFSRLALPTFDDALAELEEDFDDPRFAVFVAEHEGRVVGSAVGCSLELSSAHSPLMRPRSAGFLGFAAVLPEARGFGAGRALAEAVLAWSRDAGYEWVTTDWRSTNLEANQAWTRLGFRPSFRRLHRAIV
jgi:GNAT superfamily N-acetyltransferase